MNSSTPPFPEPVDGVGPAGAVHRCRVEWADTDAAGHHHNSLIGRLVEAAEAALVREFGFDGYFDVAPRVRYEVDFRAPLWFGQEVTTVLRVERIGTSSLTFGFSGSWSAPTGCSVFPRSGWPKPSQSAEDVPTSTS